MAGNPQVNQGTLNRLVASITWPNFPSLNITPPFLGPEGIHLTFEGDATLFIDTMTGVVTSVEPYLRFRLTAQLLKSQPISALYKTQIETLTTLGNGVVRPDVSLGLTPYQLSNCAIQSGNPDPFAGRSPWYPVSFSGAYFVNNAAWG
jgi:hypothetical protein